MARRRVDTNLIQGLVQGASQQVITRGIPRTYDEAFPVFSTPVNEDLLVYIPSVNVVADETGSTMQVLPSINHEMKIGKSFSSMRCINGLTGNPAYDALGYDGSCPACDANKEEWELYRLKLDTAAKSLGVDPQNDVGNLLRTAKDSALSEMAIKSAEEYVTFPIVIIPQKAKFVPTDDAINNLQVVYVHWRKKRYQDTILAALESIPGNNGNPAGLFWFWKFTYAVPANKQANARDSAKNAKFSVLNVSSLPEITPELQNAAEYAAREFTLAKAAEVIVAATFNYKEDIEAEVSKAMVRTRQMLALANTSGVAQGQLSGGTTPLGAGNPLANFGIAEPQAQAQAQPQAQPQAQAQAPTPEIGVSSNTTPNPANVFGNGPIKLS